MLCSVPYTQNGWGCNLLKKKNVLKTQRRVKWKSQTLWLCTTHMGVQPIPVSVMGLGPQGTYRLTNYLVRHPDPQSILQPLPVDGTCFFRRKFEFLNEENPANIHKKIL